MENTQIEFQENFGFPFIDPWGWIDFSIFTLVHLPLHDNKSILQALLKHKSYRQGYISPYDPNGPDEGPIHGPYSLDKLSVDNYKQVSWQDFTSTLNHWITHPDYSTPSDEDKQRLFSYLSSIQQGDVVVFKLEQSRDNAEHELGWILFEFEEFVILQLTQNQIIVAVWGVD